MEPDDWEGLRGGRRVHTLRPARAPGTLHKLRSSSASTVEGTQSLMSNSKKSTESGSTFAGTRSIMGLVARPLARPPGSLIPAVAVAGRTCRPTEDALRSHSVEHQNLH